MGADEAHYPVWDMEYRILVGGSRHGIGALVLWSIVNMRIFRRFPMIQEKGGNIEYAFQALHRLMLEIEQSTKHTEIVLIGSLSIIHDLREYGSRVSQEALALLCLSNDLDIFLKGDPQRTQEINMLLGEGSQFHCDTGYFAEGVSPGVPNLPLGWQSRMSSCLIDSQRELWCSFLEPHDAAASKLCRGATNDMRWVMAGIQAGLIQPDTLAKRVHNLIRMDERTPALNRLRILLQKATLPPLTEDFDWKNGEIWQVGDDSEYNAQIQFDLNAEQTPYVVQIFPSDNMCSPIPVAEEVFPSLDEAAKYIKSLEIKNDEMPSL